MDKKIEIYVYGIGNDILGSCSSKKDGCCRNCKGSSCGDCHSSTRCFQAFENLDSFLKASDVHDKISLNFIEVDSKAMIEHEEIREIIKEGYSLPVIIIDDIVRYYGGISNKLVYSDVVELIEYYEENK